MAAVVHLDTHVAAWLFAGRLDLITAPVRETLERSDLELSPIVVLELQYLFEIGRVTVPGDEVARQLEREIGLRIAPASLSDVVVVAVGLSWTRDPFDRLIVAHAIVADVPLVTKDRTIHRNLASAVW